MHVGLLGRMHVLQESEPNEALQAEQALTAPQPQALQPMALDPGHAESQQASPAVISEAQPLPVEVVTASVQLQASEEALQPAAFAAPCPVPSHPSPSLNGEQPVPETSLHSPSSNMQPSPSLSKEQPTQQPNQSASKQPLQEPGPKPSLPNETMNGGLPALPTSQPHANPSPQLALQASPSERPAESAEEPNQSMSDQPEPKPSLPGPDPTMPAGSVRPHDEQPNQSVSDQPGQGLKSLVNGEQQTAQQPNTANEKCAQESNPAANGQPVPNVLQPSQQPAPEQQQKQERVASELQCGAGTNLPEPKASETNKDEFLAFVDALPSVPPFSSPEVFSSTHGNLGCIDLDVEDC